MSFIQVSEQENKFHSGKLCNYHGNFGIFFIGNFILQIVVFIQNHSDYVLPSLTHNLTHTTHATQIYLLYVKS